MKAYSYPDGLLYFCLCDRGVRDAMDIGKESYLVKLCQPIILAISRAQGLYCRQQQ